MSLLALTASILSLAGLVLPLVELLKEQLGLKGRVVIVVSVLLGATLGTLLAAGGLVGLESLPNFPVWVSGLFQGVVAGLAASGGNAALARFQFRGAEARAEALAKAGVPAVEVAVTTDPPPAPEVAVAVAPPAPPETPPDPSLDEWRPASLNDLTRAAPRHRRS